MKNNNKLLIIIFMIIILISISIYLSQKKELFGSTSPGTLVQLASSHVPTQEDLDYYTKVYPKVVRKEITDMTGGDPGEIEIYPWG
jgi:hypothetical protein